jgi:predicted  nucleic acid-binding Zn-ribbon protein
MHPDMEKLMALQSLDLEARKLREEIAALPKHIATLESKAKTIAAQRAVVLDLIAKEEAMRRRQESDIQDQKLKLARNKQKIDNATSTAQVTALDHEMTYAQKEIARLEEAELESMMRSEELDAQKKVADQALQEAESTHLRERERAIAVVDRNNLAIADLDARRKAQRALVGETALSLYDRIAKSKGTGIAEALGQKCLACQMMLRPQRWNDLRERDNYEIMTCDSCGRLLFYDPARDAPQRKPPSPANPDAKPERQESIAAQIVRGL